MTRKEELKYLLGIQAEAVKWTVDGDDNAYELEVRERIRDIVDALEEPGEKKDRKEYDSKYSDTHVRIHEDGKVIWVYRDDAEMVNGKWVRKSKSTGAMDGNS